MSRHKPQAIYRAHGRKLTELLDAVLAGDLVNDQVMTDERVAVERQVVRVVGALVWLQQRHRVDERGRCSICRAVSRAWWRPWPKRTTCTVHSALGFFLHQPERFVMSVITDNAATAGARS